MPGSVDFRPNIRLESQAPLEGPDGAKGPQEPSGIPPNSGEMTVNDVLAQQGLPPLSTPVGGMSLDALMSAIGHDARRLACKEGVQSLEVKAQEQKEINDKQLQKMAKQLEEMKKKAVLNGFLKAFKIIGAIVGAIASVATIAAGALTANPLLIAAGVVGATMTVDSILGMATDGKVCMMNGFKELGSALGMNDKDSQWFAFAMQMTVMVVAIGVSLGAGIAGSAGGAGSTAVQVAESAAQTAAQTAESAVQAADLALQQAVKITMLAQKVMNFASAGLNVAQGGATIAGAVIDYKVADSRASQKELEAILERLRAAIDADKNLVEAEMKRSNDLLATVREIIKGCLETQTAMLTTAPAMA
jgi:hypothetical protein